MKEKTEIKNEDVSSMINKLEQESIELSKQKTKLVQEYHETRMIFAKNVSDADTRLRSVSAEIAALRRQYKSEQIRRYNKRRLSDDAKILVIQMQKHCQEDGCTSTVDLSVHHKVPISEGGTDDLENLQVLCYNHHNKKHRI